MAQKIKKMPIAIQAGLLKSIYAGSKVRTQYDQALSWHFEIMPSPLSKTYEVRLDYTLGKPPQVYVLTPLTLAKGATRLPHVYDTKKQRLCLYYPDGQQWNASMPLAKTIVPWIYDWLYHFEIWLGSGVWQGGGIHLASNKVKIEEMGKPKESN
jgi:hypothetical protein